MGVQQGPNAPNHSSSSPPNHPPVNFCDIMTVFEKAVSEVRVGQETLGKNPSVEVISLLIECGADPNVKDTSIDRNNALHVTANGKPSKPAVVKALLDGGAHLDAINKNNKTFAQLLKGQEVHEVVNVVQHTTLQCLAAKTIKKYDIPYKQTLSKQVAKFVDIH